VVADLRQDVLVPEQQQRRDGVRGAGEAAGMAGLLRRAELQRGVAQRVGDEPGLVDSRVIDAAMAVSPAAMTGAAASSASRGPGAAKCSMPAQKSGMASAVVADGARSSVGSGADIAGLQR